MEPAYSNLLTILPLCCGTLFLLIGAGLLIYALIQRNKASQTGQPAQNTNLFIILGAVFFVLSLCLCSLSVIVPMMMNR